MLLRLFKIVYLLAWSFALPVLIGLALWVIPKWKPGLKERLGLLDEELFPKYQNPINKLARPIWFHAVSVGEFNALLPILKQFEGRPIVVSTTTNSAHKLAKQKLKLDIENQNIKLIYMPWDHPWIINEVINQIQPIAIILMESELWPALISIAKAKKIFMGIINAKISDSSFKLYKLIKIIFAEIINDVDLIFAQAPQHSRKYIDLGFNKDKIFMTGNMKFAINHKNDPEKSKLLRNALGYRDADCIWIAASTHEEEEASILSIFQELKDYYPQLKLIIAPRHPERFNSVEALIASAAKLNPKRFSIFKNSQAELIESNNDVLLIDSIGDLLSFFGISNIAFIGGTLNQSVGGHNILEPASYAVPVVTGPFYHKNTDMFQLLENANGLLIAESKEELKDLISKLIQNDDLRVLVGSNGRNLITKNQKILNQIGDQLKSELEKLTK